MQRFSPTPPCVIFEDEHLLVVNKPAGWNTHAPSPYAGEGIYDWLRHREPKWATLAILHRLDKETSGVLVFGKTPCANKSLTEQFAARRVHKKYLLLTDRAVPKKELAVKSNLLRLGEKYASRPGGEIAETKFTSVSDAKFTVNSAGFQMVLAEPFTGRTHQIRVHAAQSGHPIVGDLMYATSGRTSRQGRAVLGLRAFFLSYPDPFSHRTIWIQAPVDEFARTFGFDPAPLNEHLRKLKAEARGPFQLSTARPPELEPAPPPPAPRPVPPARVGFKPAFKSKPKPPLNRRPKPPARGKPGRFQKGGGKPPFAST